MKQIFSSDGLYARTMERFWELLMISIFWLIGTLPIITAGAAATAAYYTGAKVVRHGADRPIPAFLSSFKTNLRQSILPTILFLLLLATLVMEGMYLYSDPNVGTGMLYLMVFLTLSVLGVMLYFWPCLSRFDRSSFSLLRMAVILTFRHLPATVLLLGLYAAVAAAIWFMPWGILVFPGAAVWAETFLMERILLRYSPRPEGDEAEKWYYQ